MNREENVAMHQAANYNITHLLIINDLLQIVFSRTHKTLFFPSFLE
jgi:hypothetical protein